MRKLLLVPVCLLFTSASFARIAHEESSKAQHIIKVTCSADPFGVKGEMDVSSASRVKGIDLDIKTLKISPAHCAQVMNSVANALSCRGEAVGDLQIGEDGVEAVGPIQNSGACM